MSDTFILTAHLPIAKETFQSFLQVAPANPAIIKNRAQMFAGWGWDGKAAAWKRTKQAANNLQLLTGFANRIFKGGDPSVLVFAHDNEQSGFDFYWTCLGFDAAAVQSLLLTLASARDFMRDGQQTIVLLSADPGGVIAWPEEKRVYGGFDPKELIDALGPQAAEILMARLREQLQANGPVDKSLLRFVLYTPDAASHLTQLARERGTSRIFTTNDVKPLHLAVTTVDDWWNWVFDGKVPEALKNRVSA